MPVPKRLLAKSSTRPDDPRPEETLPGHTAFVLAAADELLAARGLPSLGASGLSSKRLEGLSRIVQLAAFMHDLGKCSDQFQQMIRRERDERQLVRHEALSLWLSWPGQPLSGWLRSGAGGELEYRLAVIAAAGHHRKFWSRAVASEADGAGTRLTLLVSHEDFLATLQLGVERLGLPPLPVVLEEVVVESTRRSDPRRKFEAWQVEADDLVHPGSEHAKLLAVAKALVLAADVAGSALPRGGEEARWIGRALGARTSGEDVRGVAERRLGGKSLRPFQEATAASAAPVTLVRAGCGTGKTVAAYLWAAARHPGRQLWVTYPTTGTATEGFRDYIEGADVTGRLEHGRAEVDLEILGLRDGSEGTRDRDRLDAIRAWGCDVVTCTVDTVLGLVQNQRKGLYAWPAIADSAVVFDEIHAYDDQLFGSLLRFLEALPGIPALLMTASLPAPRLAALRDLVGRVHGTLAEIPGPDDLERLARYRLDRKLDAWDAARTCLAAGGKVLWVSNTVDRCLAVADRARSEGLAPLIYHSRFRYRDRVARHRDVIEAFGRDGPALATTTQVAEMSLDLSADLLVTDLAPIPALIQRLGRLNRRSSAEQPLGVKPWIVVQFHGEPYARAELDEAAEWCSRLSERELGQSDLVEAWSPEDGLPPEPVPSNWLDGRFATEPAPLREGSPGVTIVLEGDARAVREGRVRAVEVSIPMNPPPGKPGDWMSWPRARYLPVPPAHLVTYDPMRGAQWRRARK